MYAEPLSFTAKERLQTLRETSDGFVIAERDLSLRGHHHRRTGVERQANAGQRGPDAGVFSDAAVCVLRHIEVGTDEDALTSHPALGTQVGKPND
jgi:hypothetical protein